MSYFHKNDCKDDAVSFSVSIDNRFYKAIFAWRLKGKNLSTLLLIRTNLLETTTLAIKALFYLYNLLSY